MLKLGYKEEVLKTLAYVLERFERAGSIATTISPSGRPFNFLCFAPDSLPFLVRSLNVARAKNLLKKTQGVLGSSNPIV
ncbi:MAG: hypothetical protein QXT19_04785 [Candidatus Woesearchaeota archaeon]